MCVDASISGWTRKLVKQIKRSLLDNSGAGAWSGKTHQELARVGPGVAVEALDGDRALGVELAPVDDVGRLVAALRDDVLGGEARGGEAQLLEGELLERREVVPLPCRRRLPICIKKSSITWAQRGDF
jgi:hypothetical protein